MDPSSADNEHNTTGEEPERPTATTSSGQQELPTLPTHQGSNSATSAHQESPTAATMTHAQQPAIAALAGIIRTESPLPILPNSGLSNVPAVSWSSIEKGSLDDDEDSRPLPPLPVDIRPQRSVRLEPLQHRDSARPRSAIDWAVPVGERAVRQKAIGERLDPTLLTAKTERDRCAFKAKMTGYALNTAIGLQVLLGSLTTGLSAATTGRQTAIATTILGALSTIVASYLASSRGSNEPELSTARVKDLEQFIRECEAFKMDNGHVYGDKFDSVLENFRVRFEELLGNGNSERRVAPPA